MEESGLVAPDSLLASLSRTQAQSEPVVTDPVKCLHKSCETTLVLWWKYGLNQGTRFSVNSNKLLA